MTADAATGKITEKVSFVVSSLQLLSKRISDNRIPTAGDATISEDPYIQVVSLYL